MPLESFISRAAAVRIEAVEGTDIVPTFATHAFRFLNGSSSIEAEKIERDLDRPTWGAKPFVPTGFKGVIEGDIELVGNTVNGTATPLAPVLRIGGMAETLVVGPPALARYNPISSAIPSASCYFQHGGTIKRILGARAAISGIALEVKKYPMAKVRIEGNATEATEAAYPGTVDYSAFVDPLAITTENAVMVINGFNVDGIYMSLDLNTELKVKEHTEARLARITDRQPTGVVRFVRPAFASLNPWALFRNQTTFAMSFVNALTGTPASRVMLSIATAQFEEPKEIDWEGDIAYEVPFRALPATGGEFLLEFGGGT